MNEEKPERKEELDRRDDLEIEPRHVEGAEHPSDTGQHGARHTDLEFSQQQIGEEASQQHLDETERIVGLGG